MQQVPSDLLHAWIRPHGLRVNRGSDIAWGFAEPITPPDGSRVEYQVPSGSMIESCRVFAAIGLTRGPLCGARGHDFQTRNGGWISMPLPSHQSGNALPLDHTATLEEPMVRLSTNPVGSARYRPGALRPHEFVRIGPFMYQMGHGVKFPGAAGGTKDPDALKDPIRSAMGISLHLDTAANRIAGKEGDVHALLNGSFQISKHLQRPILIVSHGKKPPATIQLFGILVGVLVGDIGQIVTVGLHPISQGELPKQEFTGPGAQGCIQDLAVLSVRSIEPYFHAASPIPLALPVVIKGKLIGPAIVGLPGMIAALEHEIGLALVFHDENHITLHRAVVFGELGKVNAAEPIARNDQFQAGVPMTVL